MDAKQPVPKYPSLHQTEDFASVYANHSFIEPSEWDLKVTFGQLNQSLDPAIIEQHTAVTLPWNQAKIFLHFLRVQVAAYEITHGTIPLAPSILPPEVPTVTDEARKLDPKMDDIHAMISRARQELIEGKPFV